MAKELPYFKFYISEWTNGDITLEDYELQGLFISICAYYWSKDGDLSTQVLLKRFRGYDNQIKQLTDSKIIKIKDGNISISFLNEQLQSKQLQKYTNKANGAKGGRPKKDKTEDKPNGLLTETEGVTESKANDNPNETNIDYSIVDYRKEEKDNIIIDHILLNSIMSFFNFNEIANPDKMTDIAVFLRCLEFNKRTEYFREQFSAYCEIKNKDPKYKHAFKNFIGTIKGLHEDGAWNEEVWTAKLNPVLTQKRELVR